MKEPRVSMQRYTWCHCHNSHFAYVCVLANNFAGLKFWRCKVFAVPRSNLKVNVKKKREHDSYIRFRLGV